MSYLEKKQREFQDELLPISKDYIAGKLTEKQYRKKKDVLIKKYGFNKGLDYFR